MLKFSPILGIFRGFFFLPINYKYLNLFAGEVPNTWKKRIFLYVSAICFQNYLALLNTTQWWFSWQKMASDWLRGGLVHLNLNVVVFLMEINFVLLHIWDTSLIYLGHFLDTSGIYVRHIWNISETFWTLPNLQNRT